jgi:hypothetical protein
VEIADLLHKSAKSACKSSAAAEQKNENENTCGHSHQPQNDVSDLALLIAKFSHISISSWYTTVRKTNAILNLPA